MLIASSLVEIETKAEEAGLTREAHDMTLRMVHALTDRISALLHGLGGWADILDMTHGVPDTPGTPSGLYAKEAQALFVGILAAHRHPGRT